MESKFRKIMIMILIQNRQKTQIKYAARPWVNRNATIRNIIKPLVDKGAVGSSMLRLNSEHTAKLAFKSTDHITAVRYQSEQWSHSAM